MNNKRRHTLCILILIMTSLFLYSCGEPSLCTLSNITISSSSKKFEDNKTTVTVSGTDTDLEKLTTGPGLFLCYCFAQSEATFDSDAAITPFANMVKNKLIINEDNSILTFGTDNTVLYALQKDIEGTRISSPAYCYNLYSSISGTTLDKSLTLTYENDRKFDLEGYTFYTTTLPDDVEGLFIYVYAAFSAEQGSFSNNYWSKLVCLGSIPIVKTTD